MHTNEVFHSCDEFYLSFNPTTKANPMVELCDSMISLLGGEACDGRPETALCIYDTTKRYGVRFLILYGDHREGYRNALKHGLEGCKDYFLNHIEEACPATDMPYKELNA